MQAMDVDAASAQRALDDLVAHVDAEIQSIKLPARTFGRGDVFVTAFVVDAAAGKRLPRTVYVFPDVDEFFCRIVQSLADRDILALPTDDDTFRTEGAALDLFLWLASVSTSVRRRSIASVHISDPDQPVLAGARHVSVISVLPRAEPDPARLTKLIKRAFV